ncbi:hypothetical protein ACFOOK_21905 [Micromonospora krabiensis]|uniref:Uncharacterized protein n=1 Tax=Micromonospora krabiensis TaxID=307121 RepID=A0A1C3N862_9ACTN|nr:hypothetical protein [Micromonospora krabiensis]SBV28774.1 hypothetical protein GA0070620_4328 [Micromonospora krabiensis]
MGLGLAVGLGDVETVTVGEALGDGLPVGVPLGDGLGEEVGRGLGRPGRGLGTGGSDRRTGSSSAAVRSERSGPPGGSHGDQPLAADGAVTLGVADGIGGWLDVGSGITTGPTDGVGMNGVLLSGRAVLPTVAEPALIAARIGIEAVPARSATVKR